MYLTNSVYLKKFVSKIIRYFEPNSVYNRQSFYIHYGDLVDNYDRLKQFLTLIHVRMNITP